VKQKSNRQLSLFQGVVDEVADGEPPVSDERPAVLASKTYRLKAPVNGETLHLYMTISDREGRPFEFFLNCSNMELSEYLAAVSVLASRMLRNGFSAEAVASDLIAIESPFTGHLRKGGYCPSLSALIARTLLAHVSGTALP